MGTEISSSGPSGFETPITWDFDYWTYLLDDDLHSLNGSTGSQVGSDSMPSSIPGAGGLSIGGQLDLFDNKTAHKKERRRAQNRKA